MNSPFAEALRMVQRDAPWFAKQLKEARRLKTSLTLSLDAFDDNPLLLYAALWVASRDGVTVSFTPIADESPS